MTSRVGGLTALPPGRSLLCPLGLGLTPRCNPHPPGQPAHPQHGVENHAHDGASFCLGGPPHQRGDRVSGPLLGRGAPASPGKNLKCPQQEGRQRPQVSRLSAVRPRGSGTRRSELLRAEGAHSILRATLDVPFEGKTGDRPHARPLRPPRGGCSRRPRCQCGASTPPADRIPSSRRSSIPTRSTPTSVRSPSKESAITRCWRSRTSSTGNSGTCSRSLRPGSEPASPGRGRGEEPGARRRAAPRRAGGWSPCRSCGVRRRTRR
jgi:hypothetical protein